MRVVRRSGRRERIGDTGWLIGRYSDGLLRVHFDRDCYATIVRPEAIRGVARPLQSR